MRYQVKEALDHVSAITRCHPNALQLSRLEPNKIEVLCIDEELNKHKFLYRDGKVRMWDNVVHEWVQVIEGPQYMSTSHLGVKLQ